MAQQLFTTTDGKECRPVNPYASPDGEKPHPHSKYWFFEQEVKHYPIHSDNPPIGEFLGEVVWQYRTEAPFPFINVKGNTDVSDKGYETRLAVQPIPVKGEGKVEDGVTELELMFRNFIRQNQLTDKWDFFIRYYPEGDRIVRDSRNVHNSAIDDATKKLHTGLFASDELYDYAINTIKSLKK